MTESTETILNDPVEKVSFAGAIRESVQETLSNDDFYKGVVLGAAAGAIGYHLFSEYGESIKDKVTDFFTAKTDKKTAKTKSDDVVLEVKVPADLHEAFKAHEKEVQKEALDIIRKFKEADEAAAVKDATAKDAAAKDTGKTKVKVEKASPMKRSTTL